MTQATGSPVEDWVPPAFPAAIEMKGRLVTVSPLRERAFGELWDAFSADDGSMWTYMGYGPFPTRASMDELTAGWLSTSDPLFFTFDVEGRAQGWGSLLRIEPQHGVIEIGHLALGPSLRQTAAATEAMYLLIGYVFGLGYRRCEWKCDSLNRPSRRAAERLGFTYEGTFRQHMVYKGRNRDTSWYSITDTEWPTLSLAVEKWLDPSNFDEGGRQRRRLAEIRMGGS